jgi:choline dehydrogenase-like flavoprotein
MEIVDLLALDGRDLETDLVIVGGGAAGLSVAWEFLGQKTRVVVLESGKLDETDSANALNEVESIGEPASDSQRRHREKVLSFLCPSWSPTLQPYGLRCRGLGGSTHSWAGKSAAFDDIDFSVRNWVPFAGWPIKRDALEPYLERAAARLNLGPNCYDEELWRRLGVPPPQPSIDPDLWRSYFWQFARSRIDRLDVLRMGKEFEACAAANIRVVVNATVTRITADGNSNVISGVEVSTINGRRSRVRAKAIVLAASAIENPRLLLASNAEWPAGLGNQHDTVGRYLMDHPSVTLGRIGAEQSAKVLRRFGYYGLRHAGRVHMFQHGLAASFAVQTRQHLLNASVYFSEERALDDPWDALKNLLRLNMRDVTSDLLSIASSPGLLAKGLGLRLLNANRFPERMKQFIVDSTIALRPDLAVREFLNRGLPHKVTGINIDAISEQPPDAESRITLSRRADRLGVPLAKVDWRVAASARRTLGQMGTMLEAEFERIGLPKPLLADWVREKRYDEAPVIDMGHTLGTTRMSENPRYGVVDPDCRLHGFAGLYVAGGSVFPTSGHANPTLMIVALCIRLADRIKVDLARDVSVSLDARESA